MLNLNINSEESNINDFLEIWNEFKSRPNQFIIDGSYDFNIFNILDISNINKVSELIATDFEYKTNDRLLGKINNDIFLSYFIIENEGKKLITDLVFLYKDSVNYEEVCKILEKIDKHRINDISDDENSLNILNFDDSNNLKLEKIDSKEIDLDKFYSKYTSKSLSSLFKKIKKSKSGLSIFYGERGTGKTSVIKSLPNILDKNIFFIPNNIIEHTILNAGFINFIKKYNESVLIIDDFELVIDNYSRYNSVINTITQLVDSLISEIININIILIFNTESLSEIEDLIDCNSLLDIIKFDYLTQTEANKLSNYLGSKIKYKNNSRLLDIINSNNTNYKKRVGF